MTAFMLWNTEVLTHKCPFFYVELVRFCAEMWREERREGGFDAQRDGFG